MRRILTVLAILGAVIFVDRARATTGSKPELAVTRNQSSGGQATQIVFLGTGTPIPDPDRSGPSVAIVVNGTPYLIDFGPGVVRRAAAAYRKGIAGLSHSKLTTAFVTHLHSDHTVGYPDLIFTPWV